MERRRGAARFLNSDATVMALSVAPARLKRYVEVARLFVKYGRGPLADDLSRDLPLSEPRAGQKGGEDPGELARDLEKLGPTFIKLGQLLSSRADLLPTPYLEALSRLQDRVEPFSFEEVEKIVEAELGTRISRAFSSFEPEPLASASLGQVHRARMRDGRPVAVKVQRPGIREGIAEDLEALRDLASFMDRHSSLGDRYQLEKTVETFGRTLVAELDYRREAQNLIRLSQNLERFERIVVPLPVEGFTTERVLTMELVEGRKITDLDPLTALDIDGTALADELFRAYLHQVVIDGFFHADPHPGNVFLTDDGRVALLDLGMVGLIPPGMRDGLFRLLMAIGEGQGDEAAERALALGEKQTEDFDETGFRSRVSAIVGDLAQSRLADVQLGRVVIAVARAAGEAGVRIPTELTMLGKTLWSLDEIGKTLDPTFDPAASIRGQAADLLRRRMAEKLSPGHIAAALVDAKEFVEEMPKRLNRILDLVSRNALRVKIDAIDENALITGLQKIANRIAMGVVLAALIVGAAIVMQIPTRIRILGYPALAMVLFGAAAIGGIALIGSILMTDRKQKLRPK